MIGSFAHSLDDKNRITIPSKYRSSLGELIYLTLNAESAIEIRTQEQWDVFQKENLALKNTTTELRIYKSLLFGNTFDVPIDKQGRILLPLELLKQTKINKEIQIVGAFDKIEIWPRQTWLELTSKWTEVSKKALLESE